MNKSGEKLKASKDEIATFRTLGTPSMADVNYSCFAQLDLLHVWNQETHGVLLLSTF